MRVVDGLLGETRPREGATRSRDRGQAMIEFVLISPLLFLLVGGIVQTALALNFWLDMQRIANQGARWAVVARYPLPDGTMCTTASDPCVDTLESTLAAAAQSDGLDPSVCISFPLEDGSGGGNIGEPVRIRLETDFTFVPILGIGTVTLGADAEMRIEQQRETVYGPTPGC